MTTLCSKFDGQTRTQTDGRTDGRTDGQTDGRTDATNYIISLASRSIMISEGKAGILKESRSHQNQAGIQYPVELRRFSQE